MVRAKKITLILGVIAVLFGAGLYFSHRIANNMRNELNSFVEPMYAEIVANNWDVKIIRNYASPDFKKGLDEYAEDDRSKLQKFGRKLGKMKQYKGIVSFEENESFSKQDGNALANVLIDFESGPRLISTTLVKINGKWYLNEFNVFKVLKEKPEKK